MSLTVHQHIIVLDSFSVDTSASFVRGSLAKLANNVSMCETDTDAVQLGLAVVNRSKDVSVHLLAKPQSFCLKDFHGALGKVHHAAAAGAAMDTKKLGKQLV